MFMNMENQNSVDIFSYYVDYDLTNIEVENVNKTFTERAFLHDLKFGTSKLYPIHKFRLN